MYVSKNRGTPKSSILIGFSIINHPFWWFYPYFWKHIYIYICVKWPGDPNTNCSFFLLREIFAPDHHLFWVLRYFVTKIFPQLKACWHRTRGWLKESYRHTSHQELMTVLGGFTYIVCLELSSSIVGGMMSHLTSILLKTPTRVHLHLRHFLLVFYIDHPSKNPPISGPYHGIL